MRVKIFNGSTFSIIKRAPALGRRSYVWVGDNGQEMEFTDEEAAELQY